MSGPIDLASDIAVGGIGRSHAWQFRNVLMTEGD